MILFHISNKVGYNLESKGFDLTLQCEDVLELFNATDKIYAAYEDERISPMGDWRGDLGKLVSFCLYLIYLLGYKIIF